MNQIDKNQESSNNEELLSDTVNSLNGLFSGDQAPHIDQIINLLKGGYQDVKKKLQNNKIERLDSKIAHILYYKLYQSGNYTHDQIAAVEFALLDIESAIFKKINAIHSLNDPLSEAQIQKLTQDLRLKLESNLQKNGENLSDEEKEYWEEFMNNGIQI